MKALKKSPNTPRRRSAMTAVLPSLLAMVLAAGWAPGRAWADEPSALDGLNPLISGSVESSTPETDARPVARESAPETSSDAAADEEGYATWYGPRFHGKRTASGERYNMHALTAAHPSLPFGTLIRVRSLLNGKQVTVRVNDRGPFTGSFVIDLSRAAAQAIGLLSLGTKQVAITVLPAQASRSFAAR